MKMRNIITLILSILLIASYTCIGTAAVTIPEPSESFYVYDEANILSEDTEKSIIVQNEKLHQSTGAQIVVSAVNSTEGETTRAYARQMFNTWKIGNEKNNGILILLVLDKNDYHVIQGGGIDDKITSADIKSMIDNCLEPSFAVKDYDKGVTALFEKLLSTYQEIYEIELDSIVVEAKADTNLALSVLTTVAVSAGIILFIFVVTVIVRIVSDNRYIARPRRAAVNMPQRSSRPAPHPNSMRAPRPAPQRQQVRTPQRPPQRPVQRTPGAMPRQNHNYVGTNNPRQNNTGRR